MDDYSSLVEIVRFHSTRKVSRAAVYRSSGNIPEVSIPLGRFQGGRREEVMKMSDWFPFH